jgi:hypothetical protein
MKLPPLAGRKRSEYRMVEHSGALAEAGFALCDQFVHGLDLGTDFAHNFVRRQAARLGALGRFPSVRQMQEPGYDERFHPVLKPGRPG